MIRKLALLCALAANPAMAQDQSLADVRAELATLAGEIQSLRSELVASGAKGMQAAGGSSALERMDTMEAALTRLTAQTEQLSARVDRVVKDGTNRIGDLEFRLCEATPGCDISTVGQASTLGGDAGSTAAAVAAPAAKGPELAMNEQADFDRAKEVLGQGDFRGAADLFAAYAQSYPGGPLTSEAMFLRGEALSQAGDSKAAARAYLDGFSADQKGAFAADSLFKLGTSLKALGQTNEACATLKEVQGRYVGSAAASDAVAAAGEYGCQ